MQLRYLFILFFFTAQIASAQVSQLTLQEARNLALENSEDVKIANQQLQKAVAQKAEAFSNYLPKLSASAKGIYQFNNFEKDYYLPTATPNTQTGELEANVMTDNNGAVVTAADGTPIYNEYAYLPLKLSLQGAYFAGIQIEQAVYMGGKIKAANHMASTGMQLAKENTRKEKIETIVETDRAYWLYVSVQEKVKLAKSSVAMLDSLLKQIKISYEAGLVQRNEVLKVQVKYNNARLNLQKAKSGLDLSRMSLCRIIGKPFETQLKTDSVITVNDSLIVAPLSEDYKRRPEYQMLNQQIQLKTEAIKKTRADFLPSVGIQAGAFHLGGVELNDADLEETNYNIMASVSIPIFHWGEGHKKIEMAKADETIQKLNLSKNAKLMQLQIERSKRNLQDAYFRVKISHTALLQASENLRVSKDNYEVGKEVMTDLLIAQTEWQDAYNKEIEAKTNYQLYATEYLQATANLIINETASAQ